MLLMIVGTVASVAAHHIKANHREAMFIAFATGFNIPVWIVWATTAVLLKGKPGTEEQCLAFGLLTTTTLIFFIMFLPRVSTLTVTVKCLLSDI